MKVFLSLLLVCAVLGELTPERKENSRKLANTIKDMKELVREAKKFEKERKLQESTDTTDGGKNLYEGPKNITKEEADAPQNYDQSSTSANYRIKGFYGFYQEKSNNYFTFGMIFSFINKIIAKVIQMRLIVMYKPSRLRNLEEMEPQSVPCKCETTNNNAQKLTPTEETEIDYDCKADKAANFEVDTVKLDANYPMDLDGDVVEFTNVYLDEKAKDQAGNITKTEGQNLFVVDHLGEDDFNIEGTTKPNGTFLQQYVNQAIKLIFTYTPSSSRRRLETEPIDCTIESSTNIQCKGDIAGQITQIEKTGSDYNLSFVPQSGYKYPTSAKSQSNSAVYRKSSSGLSGGAIAGIVIACVVVLIAAAVAAIMLRKPTPPIDNTTVVDLKQENI